MLNKANSLNADTIALDLEDGVAEISKKIARENLLNSYHNLKKSSVTRELAIRTNSVSALENFSLDLEMLNQLETLPGCLLVPKVDSVDDSDYIISNLSKIYNRRPGASCHLITFVETAQALVNIKEIFSNIKKKTTSSKNKNIIHSGCVFGSDDYCADMNIERTTEGLVYARQKIATTCRAFNLDAIDMVNIDFKDNTGLIQQCIEGKKFGFSGKQLIHPNQIEDCNRLFSPDEQQIEWATQLVTEFEIFSKAGTGAFTFRGQMIDMPLLRIARNILELANRD